MIVTLGMIVDNSIVIIDCYLEKIGEGVSRWHASIESTQHFFKSNFLGYDGHQYYLLPLPDHYFGYDP